MCAKMISIVLFVGLIRIAKTQNTDLVDGICFYHPDLAKVMSGGPIDDLSPISSVQACESKCVAQVTPKCLSVNYDYIKKECLLYDVNAITAPARFIAKTIESSTYSFREVIPCATGMCYDVAAASTMIPQGGIIDELSAPTLADCETACSGNEQCRSIVYDATAKECLIYESDSEYSTANFLRPRVSPADDGKQFLERNECPTTTTTTTTTTPATTSTASTTLASTSTSTTTAVTTASATTSQPTTTATAAAGAGETCGVDITSSFGPPITDMRYPDSAIKFLGFDYPSVESCMQGCVDHTLFTCKSISYFPTEKECAMFEENSTKTRRQKRQIFGPVPSGENQVFHDRLYPCPATTTAAAITTTATTVAATSTSVATTTILRTTSTITTAMDATTTTTEPTTPVTTLVSVPSTAPPTVTSEATTTIPLATAAPAVALPTTTAGTCTDLYDLCPFWALHKQCTTNLQFMFLCCKLSCKFCDTVIGLPFYRRTWPPQTQATSKLPYPATTPSNYGYGSHAIPNQGSYGRQPSRPKPVFYAR